MPRNTMILLTIGLMALLQLSTQTEAIEGLGPALSLAKYPYLVSVNNECAGAIISPTMVLTSATCVEKRSGDLKDVFIRVGANDLNSRRGKLHYPTEINIHEYYDRPNGKWAWNLAVLVFRERLIDHVKTISLPTNPREDLPKGTYVKAIGWQSTERACRSTPQKFDLPVVGPETCEIYPDEHNICVAMGPSPRYCGGRCGDILIQEGIFGAILIGVATYNPTKACNPSYNNRMYTLISAEQHLTWIAKHFTRTSYSRGFKTYNGTMLNEVLQEQNHN